MPASDLVTMSIDQAMATKWAAGRATYSDGPWAGEHPLYEALAEVTDLLNYLDEAERQGYDLSDLQAIAANLWYKVRGACPRP
jgi:hypothetical protein